MKKQNWEISHRYNTMHDKWIVKERSDLANYYNPYLKLRYNVTSTSEATQLIAESQLTNLEEIIIDGEAISPLVGGYIFDTTGEHEVWFRFNEQIILAEYNGVGGFNPSTPITEIIEIPTDLKVFSVSAFASCEQLTKANLYTPNGSLYKIWNSCFSDCNKLKTLIIPNTVVNISNTAFQNCTSLTEINFPQNLLELSGSAFMYCTGLTELIIPDSVINITNGVFSYCSNIEKIKFPAGTKEISFDSWGQLNVFTQLKEVIIPEGIEKIESGIFYKCKSLADVILPSTMLEIQAGAFQECEITKITSLATTAPTITNYSFSNVAQNGTLYVPYGCTEAYAQWMSMEDGYLGAQGWTIQELPQE